MNQETSSDSYAAGDVVIVIETGEAGVIERIRPPAQVTWPTYGRFDFCLPTKYTLNLGKRRPSRWYGAEEIRPATDKDPAGLMLLVATQIDTEIHEESLEHGSQP